MPRIRSVPEDFEVEEVLLYPTEGVGAHLYLQVEKRLCNTDEVARSLARTLNLPRREVGYAGRKDRVAVTRQWFSVPASSAERLDDWKLPGARILERQLHTEKLRVGQLRGNRFRLVVREVDEVSGKRAEQRLAEVARQGLPNRFGRQRFGRDGKNAERGAAILSQPRITGNRQNAWLMISALQSTVFNRVLELREARLDELLIGDVAIVHVTGETYLVNQPVDRQRLESFEISPSGPMFGTKMTWPRGETAELERRVMAELGLGDPRRLNLPRGLRLYGDRRPLRVQPRDATASWRDETLRLSVELPAGVYATVLLEELFPDGVEEGPAAGDIETRIG